MPTTGQEVQQNREKRPQDTKTSPQTARFSWGQSKITISDVAEALGVSKTTVSRAISGKGRIGEDTRQRVLAFIDEMHYSPNVAAKGLAQSKTYNIGWVMPGDSSVTDLPFFQRCMRGIAETAAAEDYDILISMVFDHDISQLKRIIKNRKVDGVVLGRTLIDDERITFLRQSGVPFVVIGSSVDDRVIQIDNDHVNACRELTNILVLKGMKRLALICGSENHVVNCTRRRGFELALEEQGIKAEAVYMNAETDREVQDAVEDALCRKADCILCADDRICTAALEKLKGDQVEIPQQIRVASFYNSAALENHQPPVTCIKYDPKELGAVACRTLLDYIDGKEVPRKVLLGYEVILKATTQ